MSSCGLTLLTKACAQLLRVETLDLGENKNLFIVYPRFFTNFMQIINGTKLNSLNVQNTGLSVIMTSVSYVGTLESINVERNELRDLPPDLSSVKTFAAAKNQYLVGSTLVKLLKYRQIEDIDLSHQIDDNVDLESSDIRGVINCCRIKEEICHLPLQSSLKSINIAHNSAKSTGFMDLG